MSPGQSKRISGVKDKVAGKIKGVQTKGKHIWNRT
jgi:hypothetical protein